MLWPQLWCVRFAIVSESSFLAESVFRDLASFLVCMSCCCSTGVFPWLPIGRQRQLTLAICKQVQEAAAPDIDQLLDTELQQHSGLVQGQLSNGLKYVILPNAVPPERFEAHLEICAGLTLTHTCPLRKKRRAIHCICHSGTLPMKNYGYQRP